eukprot:939256-Lingulodinium_polyedra.AAC.1
MLGADDQTAVVDVPPIDGNTRVCALALAREDLGGAMADAGEDSRALVAALWVALLRPPIQDPPGATWQPDPHWPRGAPRLPSVELWHQGPPQPTRQTALKRAVPREHAARAPSLREPRALRRPPAGRPIKHGALQGPRWRNAAWQPCAGGPPRSAPGAARCRASS